MKKILNHIFNSANSCCLVQSSLMYSVGVERSINCSKFHTVKYLFSFKGPVMDQGAKFRRYDYYNSCEHT